MFFGLWCQLNLPCDSGKLSLDITRHRSNESNETKFSFLMLVFFSVSYFLFRFNFRNSLKLYSHIYINNDCFHTGRSLGCYCYLNERGRTEQTISNLTSSFLTQRKCTKCFPDSINRQLKSSMEITLSSLKQCQMPTR